MRTENRPLGVGFFFSKLRLQPVPHSLYTLLEARNQGIEVSNVAHRARHRGRPICRPLEAIELGSAYAVLGGRLQELVGGTTCNAGAPAQRRARLPLRGRALS